MKKFLYFLPLAFVASPALANSDFPAPSITTTLANVLPGAYQIFTAFQDWAWLAITIALGFGFLGWLIHKLSNVFHH